MSVFRPEPDFATRSPKRPLSAVSGHIDTKRGVGYRLLAGGRAASCANTADPLGQPRPVLIQELLAALSALRIHELGLQLRGRKIFYESCLNAGHRVAEFENHATIL
jgi:hypothetical protein